MACNVVYLVLIVVNSRLTLRCGRTGLRLNRLFNAGNRRPGGISLRKAVSSLGARTHPGYRHVEPARPGGGARSSTGRSLNIPGRSPSLAF